MPQHSDARPRQLCLALLSCSALLLTACGVGGGAPTPFGEGGGGGSGGAQVLTITTVSLPPASMGESFPTTQLEVVNEQGGVTWTLASGQLPLGISLSQGGMLSGVPLQEGYFPFSVLAEDASQSDTQALAIAVDTVGLSVSQGLVAGDAWTSRALTLTASGHSGTVSFSVVTNASGGALTNPNPTAGTVTWTTGTTGGVTDTVRVTEDASGDTFDLDMDVYVDPTQTHTAAFGASDVWWIDTTGKDGSQPNATDIHAALEGVGFRASSSTNAVGTTADQLADLYLRVEVLRRVNVMFLRNSDGTPGAQGLPITFPFTEPSGGYTKPAAASYLGGSPTRYSQMGIVDGSQQGIIGTAFVDSTSNDLHENDTTSGSFELGVFTNQFVSIFNSTYSNSLPSSPINAADVPALRALLYQTSSPGGRYNTLKSIGEGFARTIAAVVAHEVGHSLGLDHTSPPVTGSIMNASATIHPSASYSFTSGAVSQLGGALPGTGRTGAQSLKPGGRRTGFPGGGVVVCHCRVAPHR